MKHGISVYAGLDYDNEENLSLIETAAEMGFKVMFTSAQIPEAADTETFLDDFTDILTTAVTNDFEIILDVNAENFMQYDIDGLTLRLDDGFNAQKVTEISRKRKIQLNASTVTEDFLNDLLDLGANFVNVAHDFDLLFAVKNAAAQSVLGHVADNQNCVAFVVDVVGQVVQDASGFAHSVGAKDNHWAGFFVEGL